MMNRSFGTPQAREVSPSHEVVAAAARAGDCPRARLALDVADPHAVRARAATLSRAVFRISRIRRTNRALGSREPKN